MEALKRLYVRICRKVGPGGMTLSAWAWKHSLDTGNVWWRCKIDGLWLILFSEANHCQRCYQLNFRQVAVEKDSG
jgi:hypothetical protein